jgi:hypothetical protein
MMLAGYVGGTASWTAAGFITLPAGLVIVAALALARRADRADGRRAAPAGRRVTRAGAMAVTLLAGGVMVLAGYAGAAWSWALALALAMAGGLVVGVAFAIDRRHAAPPDHVVSGRRRRRPLR